MVVNRSREAWKTYGNVFDQFTERNLEKLASQGYFEELESNLALGKEANIFTAKNKEGKRVIIKIYRLENCNFNKMFFYISKDPRFVDIKGQKRKIIFAWTQREYRNLLNAREHIKVPTPLVFKDNIIIMECISEFDNPAPQLKNVYIEEPEKTYNEILDTIVTLATEGRLIHGDLSEFNILMMYESPVFIDLSQTTSLDSPLAMELLERDMISICRFFKKHDLKKDPEQEFISVRDRIKKILRDKERD